MDLIGTGISFRAMSGNVFAHALSLSFFVMTLIPYVLTVPY